MPTLSLDLRERILTSYDRKEGTRLDIAAGYRVSLGMVKKLLQQRRRTGDVRARHYRCGRKPMILPGHEQQLEALLGRKPDLTLRELRQATALKCSLPAIHYALQRMGLTYKKRHSMPASRTGRTWPGRGANGSAAKPLHDHSGIKTRSLPCIASPNAVQRVPTTGKEKFMELFRPAKSAR